MLWLLWASAAIRGDSPRRPLFKKLSYYLNATATKAILFRVKNGVRCDGSGTHAAPSVVLYKKVASLVTHTGGALQLRSG